VPDVVAGLVLAKSRERHASLRPDRRWAAVLERIRDIGRLGHRHRSGQDRHAELGRIARQYPLPQSGAIDRHHPGDPHHVTSAPQPRQADLGRAPAVDPDRHCAPAAVPHGVDVQIHGRGVGPSRSGDGRYPGDVAAG
jgi:hypothetical protein